MKNVQPLFAGEFFTFPLLYAGMKHIFLAKVDISLHILFFKLVCSNGKIISVCF